MGRLIDKVGPIEIFKLAAQGLHQGDELHMRSQATGNLLIRDLLPGFAALGGEKAARFLSTNWHFFLSLTMAASKCTLLAGSGVPGASVVSLISRNGTDVGVQLSSMPGRWFIADSPPVSDALLREGYEESDKAKDIGDSAVIECVGLGGMAVGAAPAVAAFFGGDAADAIARTERMREICAGRSTRFTIPSMDSAPTPVGIDARLVCELGIAPQITTGVLHVSDGVGQIGAGVAHQPIEPFQAATIALAAELDARAAAAVTRGCAERRRGRRGRARRSSSGRARGGRCATARARGRRARLRARRLRAPRRAVRAARARPLAARAAVDPRRRPRARRPRPRRPGGGRGRRARRRAAAHRSRRARATRRRRCRARGALAPGWRAALAAALDVVAPAPAELAAGLDALAAGDLAAGVAALAGRGEGLTPAGDDALAGFAAWRWARGAPVALPAQRCAPLGRDYLRCAERGELPQPAAAVLEAILAGDARRRGAPGARAGRLGRELRRRAAVGHGGRRRPHITRLRARCPGALTRAAGPVTRHRQRTAVRGRKVRGITALNIRSPQTAACAETHRLARAWWAGAQPDLDATGVCCQCGPSPSPPRCRPRERPYPSQRPRAAPIAAGEFVSPTRYCSDSPTEGAR